MGPRVSVTLLCCCFCWAPDTTAGFLDQKRLHQVRKCIKLAQDLVFLSSWLNLEVVSLAQSCLTLCDLRDYYPPGFSVHGILQTRKLEWVAIPFCRRSSDPGVEPRFPALQADSLLSEPPGKPLEIVDRGNCMLKARCLRCVESVFQESVNRTWEICCLATEKYYFIT